MTIIHLKAGTMEVSRQNRGHLERENAGRYYSFMSSCIFLPLQLIMTRLRFDESETVFHFHWILTGNAKLWGCYPNYASEFSASGEQSKYEKTKRWKLFPSCCLGFSSCSLKSWQLRLMLTSQCEHDLKLTAGVWGESEWDGISAFAMMREVCSLGRP